MEKEDHLKDYEENKIFGSRLMQRLLDESQ